MKPRAQKPIPVGIIHQLQTGALLAYRDKLLWIENNVPQEEQVLVVERSLLERAGLFQGITLETQRYLSAFFVPGGPRFMPRAKAEEDPSFKQLIPYVVMTHAERYLSYVRGKRGGEGRLIGRRSIGIGGHINPIDELPLFGGDFLQTYQAAVQREVSEEIQIASKHEDRIVALLNDDSTEVGRVHLGIVHLWTLESPLVEKREQAITQLEFLSLPELLGMRESLETWSQICLDQLPHLSRRHAVTGDPSSRQGSP